MGNRFGKGMLLLWVLALCLCGCGKILPEETTGLEQTGMSTEMTAPAVRVTEKTEAPVQTIAPEETEAASEPAATVSTEVPSTGVPYLQKIDRWDQSIFEGPGYDYIFVGTVREKGTYTIVEEAWDQEGNLWGKLKSGAGWVDLTEICSEAYANALISANYADENMLLHGAYHHYPGDGAEYAIPIAIRAYGKLWNVQLCAYEFVGDDYVLGEAFFTLPEMDEEMPLVAELAFPGDMTMYGIRFTDAEGNTHVYSIYISGRNGALILTED